MSLMDWAHPWFRALWTALEAAEDGRHGDMDRQILSLNDRVSKLEDRTSAVDLPALCILAPAPQSPPSPSAFLLADQKA